ncbi:hypothetical protein ACSQ67_023468 [Phaseolus vulgaris]
MKNSLKKLRGLALQNHNHNRSHKHASSNSIQPLGQLDELARATQARFHLRISLFISISSTYPTLSCNTSLLLGFDGWN